MCTAVIQLCVQPTDTQQTIKVSILYLSVQKSKQTFDFDFVKFDDRL